MKIQNSMSIYEKLNILSDAASMMWRVLPVERREKVMVPEWETVHSVESATVFPQMADVFHF